MRSLNQIVGGLFFIPEALIFSIPMDYLTYLYVCLPYIYTERSNFTLMVRAFVNSIRAEGFT